MTLLAFLLAVAGTGLIAVSAVGLSRPAPVSLPLSDEACAVPSPATALAVRKAPPAMTVSGRPQGTRGPLDYQP